MIPKLLTKNVSPEHDTDRRDICSPKASSQQVKESCGVMFGVSFRRKIAAD